MQLQLLLLHQQPQLLLLATTATMCKIVRLAAVVRFSPLYLDWQTFSKKTPHGARFKYKCGSCASNYLIGVNWRRLQARFGPLLLLLLLAFALRFSFGFFYVRRRRRRRHVNLAKCD